MRREGITDHGLFITLPGTAAGELRCRPRHKESQRVIAWRAEGIISPLSPERIPISRLLRADFDFLDGSPPRGSYAAFLLHNASMSISIAGSIRVTIRRVFHRHMPASRSADVAASTIMSD